MWLREVRCSIWICALPNVQDIIFYEVYLHNYGSIDEFAKANQQVPQKRKRGRPKKSQ